MDKLSNQTILERAETHETLVTTITKRQMSSSGHVCRKEKLEYLVSMGKFEGKRARGRQRQVYVASMKRRMEQFWTENKIIQSTKDRDGWTTMIVNVGGHGT